MRVAVYTLTRDRLEYTKHCFARLKELAGYPYDHFVVDNGSADGTAEWLEDFDGDVLFNERNEGISVASNQALEMIDELMRFGVCQYDLIIKCDNDCEVVTPGILAEIVDIYEQRGSLASKLALSPRVEGIANQPKRQRREWVGEHPLGVVGIIGGLFHVVPAAHYLEYRYPEDLPPAWGQDDHFCDWWNKSGGTLAYVENLVVNHYETTDGQARRYPEYFTRKREEMGKRGEHAWKRDVK